MTRCASCGAEIREGMKFCGECGTPLARSCPTCGTAAAPAQKFCGECGTPLADGPGPDPAAEPARPTGAERRLVSVLFADLVGFTTLSESRDPEEVRELLSRYFDTCRRLIELYGGTVEKFIGDAVMAVWGTPVATEDDAERAVRAALDLVAAVEGLGEEVGADGLRARAGVMTGEAAVTLGARGEGMVAGDLVNTASRAQSAAEPGSVYVGEATRRASERAVVYEHAGSFALKGKEGETPLWRARRVVSGVGGQLKSEGLEAPFVGRERELRQIKDLFHVCAEERRAQLVAVTGLAGIGKSRLAWEFYKYFDGLRQAVYWHRGRCLAYGEGVTYWALADMVRMRCRIGEDEAAETAAAKLRATLDEHVLDPEERRFVEPKLAQLLGLGERETPDRQEVFSAWRLFFERLAETYPTVLVFEDVQWADASLLDFVEHLLEASRAHALFVVTLARPELLERRPTWGAAQRNALSLYLDPLPDGAMEELLQGLVPGLPDPLRSQILGRAEGVPLYAVETVRMLLDRGLLVPGDPAYQVVGEIASLEVPETLHALVAARLDSLSAEERRLLQDAAVLGKTFAPAALAALTGQAAETLEPLLTGLVRKELLGVQSDPRSPEHGQYGFLQDIVRHVAYETLPRRERRDKHLAAAERLAAGQSEDEAAEVIASHLVDASRLDPDAADAQALRGRARDALARAGERAEALAAATEAERYFLRAAELSDEPLVEAELRARAGRMAWRAGRVADARALLEPAYEALAEGAPLAAARAAAVLAELDFTDGHPQRAVARLEPVVELLRLGAPPADRAELEAQLGRALAFAGELERATGHLDEALTLAEAYDLTETLVQALNSKSVVAQRRDRMRESQILVEGALRLALAHDLHGPALRAYNNLGAVIEQADATASEQLEIVERALELAQRTGYTGWGAQLRAALAGALGLVGRWDEGLELGHEVEAASDSEFVHGLALGGVVPLLCDRGRVGEARELLERHASMAASGNVEYSAGYVGLDAYVTRSEGRPREALALAERALAEVGAEAPTSWTFKFACREAMTSALAARDADAAARLLETLEALPPGKLTPYLRALLARFGPQVDPERGDAGFDEAERILAELERPFDLAVIRLEHGEWLRAHDPAADAEPLLAAARDTFEQLRATPWLERVAAVQAQTVAV